LALAPTALLRPTTVAKFAEPNIPKKCSMASRRSADRQTWIGDQRDDLASFISHAAAGRDAIRHHS
jgi:hypothetical protein